MTEIVNSVKNVSKTLYKWFYKNFIYDKFLDRGNLSLEFSYQGKPLVYKQMEREHNTIILRKTNETAITVFFRIDGEENSEYAIKKDQFLVHSTHGSGHKILRSLWYKGYYYQPCNRYKDGYKLIPEYVLVHKLNKNERVNEYFATLEYMDLDLNRDVKKIAIDLGNIVKNNTVTI